MNLIELYKSEINFEPYQKLQEKNNIELNREHWEVFHGLYSRLKKALPEIKSNLDLNSEKIIKIDISTTEENEDLINDLIKILIPWRKGPFQLGNTIIDSEWQCWMKWQRLESALPKLANKRIADVGSGNGYFMYQLAKMQPDLVMGFERSPSAYHQFQFIQSIAKHSAVHMDFVDSEALEFFSNFFDIVLCMGVAYHSRNPLLLLEQLKNSIKRGGLLYLESQIWPGEGSYCFFNQDRYAKIKNVYFVPTLDALTAWVKRSGFKNIEVISIDKTTIIEQRKTEYSPYESLAEFLDSTNHDLTIEGYPAPVRALIRAEKT